jgi:hypothetical protein
MRITIEEQQMADQQAFGLAPGAGGDNDDYNKSA